MPDFPKDPREALAKGILKGLGIKTIEFPPGFDERGPAYQLAWIDQQIPLLETEVAAMEARPKHKNSDTIPDEFGEFLENILKDVKENTKKVALDKARDQLMEFRSRRAALVAGMPPQLVPPPAAPTPAHVRAQKLNEITALEKEKATALSTMKSVTNDQNILQGIERSYDDKIQKIVDTL